MHAQASYIDDAIARAVAERGLIHAEVHRLPDRGRERDEFLAILRHRIVRNYKAEAEGISVDNIIDSLLK